MSKKKPTLLETVLNWLDNLARLWRIGKWLHEMWKMLP